MQKMAYTRTPTLNTELYLDSEQTIINDLHDTFSCKNSQQSTNILKGNPSTYHNSMAILHSHSQSKSHSKSRVAFQTKISQKIDDACKRLNSVQASLSKKCSQCSCLSYMRGNSGDGVIWKGEKLDMGKMLCTLAQQENKPVFDCRSEKQYIELINKYKQEIYKKNKQIQQLDNKLFKQQNQFIMLQQKYLKQQKDLIIQINGLKDLLKQKNENENKGFSQKIELERIIDEHKVKLWQIQKKFKESEQHLRNWFSKQKQLKILVKNFQQKFQNQQSTGKSIGKKSRTQRQIVNQLLNILSLEQLQQPDHNKQNYNELSNRDYHQGTLNKYEEKGNSTHRSYTVQKNKRQKTSLAINSQQEWQKQFSDQNQTASKKDQLYQFLMCQAIVIQKLII